jgi:hypothetical protein
MSRNDAVSSRPRTSVRGSIVAVAAVAAVTASSACTSSTPIGSRTPLPPVPSGSIVAFTQNPESPPLVAFDVRGATMRPVGSSVRDPADVASSFAGEALTAVVVSTRGTTTVLEIGRALAAAPERVGPPLVGPRDADFRSLSLTLDRVLVADCSSVSVLDLSVPDRWRTVGRGCWGALSPNGTLAVFSPDGQHVVTVRGDVGSPRPLFDLADVADLGTAERPRLWGAPAWGSAGLAFVAIAGNQAGVFLRRPGGEVVRLMQEQLLKTARPPILAWRPDGGLLALLDDMGTGGALRTFDPKTGAHRVVALDALGFDDLVWSPDGSSLATLTSAGALLVVGTDDVWRTRVQTTWNAMLGWTA